MRQQSVKARRNEMRLERLASGLGVATDEEKVFEAAASLADEIDLIANPFDRFTYYSECLHYICARARMDWIETVGDDEMPLEGPTA